MRKRKRKKRIETPRKWKLPEWAHRYVSACLDWEIPPIKSKRCEHIGIDRTALWQAEQKPQFVEWINRTLETKMMGENREVHTALLRKCLQGDLEAIRLYFAQRQAVLDTLPGAQRGGAPAIIGDTDQTLDELDPGQLGRIAQILAEGDPKKPR